VANPQTLYPVEDGALQKKKRKGEAPAKKTKGEAKALEALKPGDALDAEDAPQIANAGFTVSCTLATSQQDAIIVAHGGLSAGYALHLSGGHVVFVVRTGAGESFAEIRSPQAISGSTRITATLGKDRTMKLTLNGQPAGSATASKLITRQPQEEFCVAHDSMKPVTTYAAKGAFQGSITDLKVVVDGAR